LRLAAAGKEHAGILFYNHLKSSIGKVIRTVHLYRELCEPAELHNQVNYV
jgi:hypothetical protein